MVAKVQPAENNARIAALGCLSRPGAAITKPSRLWSTAAWNADAGKMLSVGSPFTVNHRGDEALRFPELVVQAESGKVVNAWLFAFMTAWSAARLTTA
jgi:hypothetical protein